MPEDLENAGLVVKSPLGRYIKEIRCVCPNPKCKDQIDHKGKLYVSAETGKYYCFRCGNHGKLDLDSYVVFQTDYLKNGDEKHENDLYDFDGTNKSNLNSILSMYGKDVTKQEIDLIFSHYAGALPLEKYLNHTNEPVLYDYLLGRGITNSEINTYHMRFGVYERFQDRIVIPVIENHKITTIMGRSLPGNNPKYLYPDVLDNSDSLFYAQGYLPGYLILVEGVFDALAIARAGYRSVASLGKRLTDNKIKKILNFMQSSNLRLLVYFDQDVVLNSSFSQDILKLMGKWIDLENVLCTVPMSPIGRDAGSSTIEQIISDIKCAIPIKYTTRFSTELLKNQLVGIG
jgi:hypothetical protein